MNEDFKKYKDKYSYDKSIRENVLNYKQIYSPRISEYFKVKFEVVLLSLLIAWLK